VVVGQTSLHGRIGECVIVTVDVLIVAAGVVGLCWGRNLCERGALSFVVVAVAGVVKMMLLKAEHVGGGRGPRPPRQCQGAL